MAVEKKVYEMSREERLNHIRKFTKISEDMEAMLRPLSFEDSNKMIENAIGSMSIPMGIATNFIINGKEYVIPMAIEEPSVIAAVSKAAKIAKPKGGFIAKADDSLMIGQVQVVRLGNMNHAKTKILKNKNQLLAIANSNSRSVSAVDLQVRQVRDKSPNNMGNMLVVELIIDTKDAMGANAVNTMCETIAPRITEITGGEVVLKILSNYSTKRMVRCRATFDRDEIGGSQIVKRILYAYALAHSDTYRAVTHNKGIMNGIDAVALATGQDFRAIEAGAHAYAARDGTYRSLTSWSITKGGDLEGAIELPLAVGIVGGIVNTHPTAKLALQILAVKSAKELATVMAAVGLAQNLAAIRALASEGIQAGHMRLHARKFSK
ncbi:MAG TPA: hydroxymethylglutaryl-CoA reductase, degradative [Nitrososphaera sp.]|jgi:hydroxymethylglutaryl-CoA reductase|nr:hydroxymethylglutaryl-CoA reductase, degradative [Nitrososphaera sp.]